MHLWLLPNLGTIFLLLGCLDKSPYEVLFYCYPVLSCLAVSWKPALFWRENGGKMNMGLRGCLGNWKELKEGKLWLGVFYERWIYFQWKELGRLFNQCLNNFTVFTRHQYSAISPILWATSLLVWQIPLLHGNFHFITPFGLIHYATKVTGRKQLQMPLRCDMFADNSCISYCYLVFMSLNRLELSFVQGETHIIWN